MQASSTKLYRTRKGADCPASGGSRLPNRTLYSRFGNFILFCIKSFGLRIIAKKVLRDFWTKHKECEGQLKSWYHEAHTARWKNPNEIKREFPAASFLPGNRVVFNIKGNDYRLIIKINYAYKILWIRFVGTHKAYDEIDAKTI